MINQIRDILHDRQLEIKIASKWGSRNSGYRESIHEACEQLPAGSSYSISHSMDWGGFAYTTNTRFRVGFDIENPKRVTAAIAQRVASSEDEFVQTTPANLWVAKESCFKSLREFKQPKVISELTTGNWQRVSHQIETCELANWTSFAQNQPKGVVVLEPHYVMGIFLTPV